MKKLPLIFIFCLLLVGCGDKSTDPVVIHAPVTSAAPKIETTAVTEQQKTTDTTKKIVTTADTTVSVDTKKPIIDDVGSDTVKPIDAQTTGISDTETTQGHIVPGVPMNYRATIETDSGTYLLDADYHLSFVTDGDDPVFHETDMAVKKGIGTIVYCSDLNASVLLDSQNVPITVNDGKMVRVGTDFLICYPNANSETFALCESDTGRICTEAIMRGYQISDELKDRLVLLGKECICHFDGQQICYEHSVELVYYFSSDFILVREGGQLHLYNLAMNALADWGEISTSNTMRFGDTKRDGDAITFVYKNGTYTYNPANAVPIPFTDVFEGEYTVLEKQLGTYFVRNKTGKTVHTAVSLPDVNYVYMASRDNTFVFIDENKNCYTLSKENSVMVSHVTLSASVRQFSYAGFRVLNADDCAFLMDGENNVLMWINGMNYASLGEFLICYTGNENNVVNILNSDLTSIIEESGSYCHAALNSDGNLVVFFNNQYHCYSPDGNKIQEKTVSGELLAFADGYFLKSENGKVSLIDMGGNTVCEPVDCDTDLTFVSVTKNNAQYAFRFHSLRNQGDIVFHCMTDNGSIVAE